MGVDCILRVGDEYHSMDRWYVFSGSMQSKQLMNKGEALSKLKELEENVVKATNLWGDRQGEFIGHYKRWISKARAIIENSQDEVVTFYTEHDVPDECWHL